MAGFRPVSQKFARSETMVFQDCVIRQLDRLNELEITVGMNLTKNSAIAYEVAIRGLHAMFDEPYATDNYKEKVKKIQQKLKVEYLNAPKLIKFEYIKRLQEWKSLLIKEFASIDILPPDRESLEMGYGDEETSEEATDGNE